MSDSPKRCPRCGMNKELTDFYKHIHTSSGLASECKSCAKEYRRKNHRTINEKRKAYRLKTPRSKEERARESKARREKYPERIKAKNVLWYAVHTGKVEKPFLCTRCFSVVPSKNLHGHHEDYSKPLGIIWVCPPCHGVLHQED